MNLLEAATRNLETLRQNPYPGRGLIIGMTQSGRIAQVCWIMGRSPNSRNRVYLEGERGLVRTEFADPSQGGDPSLVIYNAMSQRPEGRDFVVSNGHQTDALVAAGYDRFLTAMEDWEYEPDAPNFTPRISGIVGLPDGSGEFTIAIVRRASPLGETCSRVFYDYDFVPGLGCCVTTYMGDGNPLPQFEGEPYPLPIVGETAEAIARPLWEALNEENRVALAVKTIDTTGGVEIYIVNQYVAVPA